MLRCNYDKLTTNLNTIKVNSQTEIKCKILDDFNFKTVEIKDFSTKPNMSQYIYWFLCNHFTDVLLILNEILYLFLRTEKEIYHKLYMVLQTGCVLRFPKIIRRSQKFYT